MHDFACDELCQDVHTFLPKKYLTITTFVQAACMGQCSCVNILCKNGSNYEMKNVNGRTALMEVHFVFVVVYVIGSCKHHFIVILYLQAARYGKLGAMEELIKFKANCNQVDEYGNTALMLVAFQFGFYFMNEFRFNMPTIILIYLGTQVRK